MEDVVDLLFPLKSSSSSGLATDHGYSLYGTLSHLLEGLHEASGVGVFPISGLQRQAPGVVRLGPHSQLRLRLPVSWMSSAVSLAGKRLDVGEIDIRLGVPRVLPLRPAASLRSGLVVIKLAHTRGNDITPSAFVEAARRQLQEQEIGGHPTIPLHRQGPQAGQPVRRVRRVKGRAIVGYPLIVEGLTAAESYRLQQYGLGGKRKMGCGLFLPLVQRGSQ